MLMPEIHEGLDQGAVSATDQKKYSSGPRCQSRQQHYRLHGHLTTLKGLRVRTTARRPNPEHSRRKHEDRNLPEHLPLSDPRPAL